MNFVVVVWVNSIFSKDKVVWPCSWNVSTHAYLFLVFFLYNLGYLLAWSRSGGLTENTCLQIRCLLYTNWGTDQKNFKNTPFLKNAHYCIAILITGAQDILKIEGRLYDGILRKRGAIDKFFGSTKCEEVLLCHMIVLFVLCCCCGM